MRTIIFIFAFFLFANISFAQNPDIKRTYHWYFGNKAGIDFSSGSPVAVTNSAMNSIEGCASISDTAGNLLFYTDGDTVYDKNHQIMPNGTGLMGHWSAWQNSLIVPQPGNNDIYYIFTGDAFENSFMNGIRYSIVDMTLNLGMGDVTAKNILMVSPNAEGLAAVHHSNCQDIWVICHKDSTNDFYSYLLTSTGLSPPIITTIGNCINAHYGTILGIKFSPDGSMLATNNFFDYGFNPAVRDTLELYLFDKANGILNNKVLLPDSAIYGYSFSPDNKKLYVSTGLYTTKVYQYDLSIYSQSSIATSKTLIYETAPSTYYLEMQITPAGKIYLAKYSKDTLSVIDSPNLAGGACNYLDNGFHLAGRNANYSLPNFIESYFDTATCFVGIVEHANESEQIFVYPNPFNESTVVFINNINFIGNNIEIELFDMFGKNQQIPKPEIDYKNNKIEIRISRGNLINGFYQLKIITDRHTYMQKLIIIN
jgi:DNA-binding beta-propeller fold protein YncE